MPLFEFSFSKPLFFPFICPIINLFQDLLAKGIGIKGHLFLNSAVFFIGEMLSILIELVARSLQKDESNETIANNKKCIKPVNKANNLQEKQKHLSLLIFISCLFEFIVNILMNFFLSHYFVYYMIQLEGKSFPMFALAFMNKYILKEPFEKHNKLAIIIILIGAGPILITHFINKYNTLSFLDAIIITIFFFIVKSIAAGKEHLDTFILQTKYSSPFQLLFYQGLFGFIASIICSLIFNGITCKEVKGFNYCGDKKFIENYATFFSEFKSCTFLYLIGYILMVLALNVFRMQTKYYLSTFHRVLSCIITSIINWFLFIFIWRKDYQDNPDNPDYSKDKKDISDSGKIVEMIGFIVILFGVLVYSEVIICKFQGFDENTKKEIEKRDWLESNSISLIRDSLATVQDDCGNDY